MYISVPTTCIKMDLFRRGKFQGCLDYTRSCLTRTGVSVCQELRLKNDVLVCQYMLVRGWAVEVNLNLGQIFLLVDLREFLIRLRVVGGGEL